MINSNLCVSDIDTQWKEFNRKINVMINIINNVYLLSY